MKHFLATAATSAIFAIGLSAGAAGAATVNFTPLDAPALSALTPVANITTGDSTGTYYENVVQNQSGALSPWDGTTNYDTGVYSAVEKNSTATFHFNGTQSYVSLIWGSPDTYNDMVFELSGGGQTVTVNGSEVFGTPGELASAVTISDVGFDTLTIKSNSKNAFEFANLTVAAVPLPATGVMLLGGLGALGLAKRRKKKAANA